MNYSSAGIHIEIVVKLLERFIGVLLEFSSKFPSLSKFN